MNILVCGGTRFMGRHLVNSLIAKGYSVTIATRGITPDTFGDSVNRINVNRLDYDSMKNAFNGKSYDVVYDTLAYCSNGVKILLDNVECGRYITISTTAVYKKHIDTREEEFNPYTYPLKWLNREDDIYDEVKRQAECAICQAYPQTKVVMARFPFVIGTDDFTERLKFYVEHILQNKPMNVDNLTAQMAFVRSDEAGKFLAYLADSDFIGVINGASEQTVSIQNVADYVTLKTGKNPIFSPDGDVAPYNGENEYSINVDRAKSLRFSFTTLHEWIYELVDYYIDKVSQNVL
ncbi:MAG: NAD-dependent epimerase/dehydratase family protein [Ruminococcus sp.]|jgi:nucleoside-diphosphate-sugar epimerase|nr:NAD-dependent epimerase/dehydratase family protein [Ruminococcus sp.]